MVAVKAHEAGRALARPDPNWRVWLVYGPDAGLVSERARDIIRAALGGSQDDPFRYVRLEGDDLAGDPQRLIDEASTIGLFGGDRVIHVSRTGKQITSAVAPLLERPQAGAVIVIEGGEFTRRNPLLTLCTASKFAATVPCYADDAGARAEMVDSALRAAGLAISRDARELLLASIGNDRMVSRQEIEKLICYMGDARGIELADVALCVGDAALRETNTLADAAFSGNGELADHSWRRLLAEGSDAGVLATALAGHAGRLLGARLAMDAGQSAEAVLLRWSMPFPRKKPIMMALSGWSSARLVQAMRILCTAAAEARRNDRIGEEIVQRALISVTRQARG
jgi:DNA polymerase-3 subunit delta